MRGTVLRSVLVLVLFGFGTWAFALDNAGSWLVKGLDARNREDYPMAFQCFKMAAEAGNAKAEYNLGYCYLTGQGVVRNDAEAVRWFQKSADQGDAQGEYGLASCYENGWGINGDLEKAKENYQKANQQGFAGGDSALRRLNGESPASGGQPAGAPAVSAPGGGGDAAAWVSQGSVDYDNKNYTAAVSLFRKAADAGNSDGECELGACYLSGNGVPVDNNLGAKWVRKGADAGNVKGQVLMGVIYGKGMGVKLNYREAAKWFQKAADQGSPEGEFFLGVSYIKGEGVPKDINKGKELIQKSAAQGFEPAKQAMSKLSGG